MSSRRVGIILDATAPTDFDPDAKRQCEECRLLGIFGPPGSAVIVALGPHALRQRGWEAAAIVNLCYAMIGVTISLGPQPQFPKLADGDRAVGENGNLTNGLACMRELLEYDAICQFFANIEDESIFATPIASETDRGF